MKLTKTVLAAAMALGFLAGCGGGNKGTGDGKTPVGGSSSPGVVPTTLAAVNKFNAALDAFNTHDKANDWNEGVCESVTKLFEAAVDAQDSKKLPEANYNAGLAYQRCGNDAKAKEYFQKALSDKGNFHYARSQLALYQYKADNNVDGAISALEQAVKDAGFQNVPALVNLAMFQMRRDSKTVGENCKAFRDNKEVSLEDFECAKLNLQRALAIDDSYMPAFNQLGLYYFQAAKKRAGGAGAKLGRSISSNASMGKRADQQQLELAALVCSQAMRKDKTGKYAPIHNTAGLILYELGQINGAVREFQAASGLDPKFFEAHMNFAAVNLSFRGFDVAEKAYRKALELHGNDYDAHLGLALALRGQIQDDANYEKQVSAVASELDQCKKLDGSRPDAFFNDAILTQEYKAKSGGDIPKQLATLREAQGIFKTFIEKAKAKHDPIYQDLIKKSETRVSEMQQTIDFLKDTPATPPAGAPPAPAPTTAPK